MGAHERKPSEKGKAMSYLYKTYKRARKKQQEGNIVEESTTLPTTKSDLDASDTLEHISTALMELHQSHIQDSRTVIDVETSMVLEMTIQMARRDTYHRKGKCVLPSYLEALIDFYINEDHFDENIWEDPSTSKPSCTCHTLDQLLHDGPLRTDLIDVYFRILELFHIEYREPVENAALFLRCEIQTAVLQSLSGVTSVTPKLTNNIIDSAQSSIKKFMADISLSDLEQCRYLFILMNIAWHWYLLVLDLKDQQFYCYNSMWSINVSDDANKYAMFVRFWLSERVGLHIPEGQVHNVHDCAQQKFDSVDCRVHMLMFAEILTRGCSSSLRNDFKEDVSLYRSWVMGNILFHRYCTTYKKFWLWYERKIQSVKD